MLLPEKVAMAVSLFIAKNLSLLVDLMAVTADAAEILF